VSGCERCLVELAGSGFRGGDESWNAQFGRNRACERLEALMRGAVRDALLTESQTVEEKRLDGQVAA
jgi:hypothetical protein